MKVIRIDNHINDKLNIIAKFKGECKDHLAERILEKELKKYRWLKLQK